MNKNVLKKIGLGLLLGGLTVLGTVKLLPQEVLSNLTFVVPPIWVLLL